MSVHNFTCGTCSKEFPWGWRARDAHCDAKHHSPPEFECDVCPRYFKTSHSAQQHMESRRHFPHLCAFCGERWPTAAELRSHEEEDHDHWVCDECGDVFDYDSKREHHERTTHRFECEWCPCEFPSAARRRRHEVKAHHAHLCRECGELQLSASGLKAHSLEHERDWTCPLCEFPFRSKQWYTEHMRAHHFWCGECHVLCFNRDGIERHLRSPPHIGPVECPFCPREFDKAAPLVQHLETGCPGAPRVGIAEVSNAITNREPMGYLVSLLGPILTVVPRKDWLGKARSRYGRYCWRCPVCIIEHRPNATRGFETHGEMLWHLRADRRLATG